MSLYLLKSKFPLAIFEWLFKQTVAQLAKTMPQEAEVSRLYMEWSLKARKGY